MAKGFVGIKHYFNNNQVSLKQITKELQSVGYRNLSLDAIKLIRTNRFTTQLTNFLRKDAKETFEKIKQNIISRWWQYEWQLGKTGKPEKKIGKIRGSMNTGSPFSDVGKPIITLLSELEYIIEKTDYTNGIHIDIKLDLSKLTDESVLRSGGSRFSGEYEYWLVQEFGLVKSKEFKGKHFLLKTNEEMYKKDLDLLKEFETRISTRVLNIMRKIKTGRR